MIQLPIFVIVNSERRVYILEPEVVTMWTTRALVDSFRLPLPEGWSVESISGLRQLEVVLAKLLADGCLRVVMDVSHTNQDGLERFQIEDLLAELAMQSTVFDVFA